MKHSLFIIALFCIQLTYSQTNYISNGGFESYAAADSSYLTAGSGDLTGKPGVWQLSAYGNTASSPAQVFSKIVDTTAVAGTKSMAVNVVRQTAQWSIRLFQSIAVVPAEMLVLTFYMKADVAGVPFSIDILKASQSFTSLGTTAPYSVQFSTTKNWKQYKMYLDFSTWTLADRTNLRISMRPNTVVGSTTPTGPYPKKFWLDEISLKKNDPLAELKDVAVQVAMDRKYIALDAGFTAEANSLNTDINTLINTTVDYPVVPDKAIGFNPAIQVTTNNIHIDALHAWAAAYLLKPLSVYPWSEPNNTIIPKSKIGKDTIYTSDKYNDSREMGEMLQRLHWLVVSPYSNYRYNPELFRRFLHLVYATSDDYKTYCYAAGGTLLPGGTANSMNDWFAISELTYDWRIATVSFAQYLPATMVQQMKDAALAAGKLHYDLAQAILSGNYANRDVSYAEVLMHTGMFLNNQTWIDFSKQLVDSIYKADLYPDGAHAYIWHQNESGSYHAGNNASLAKIWAVSEYQNAWDCIAKGANYELMTIEGSGVPEYYTVPAWKTTWNGIPGFSGEALLGITGNPWLKTKFDNYRTGNPNPIEIPFYRNDIVAKPIPDNCLVYDRNLQGPRGRYGRFSYSATVRNVAGTGSSNQPGLQTVMGSMQTRPLGTSTTKDNLDAAVMCIHNKVHVNAGNTTEWDKWAYMLSNVKSNVCVGQTASAVTASGTLQYQSAGPTGRNTDWSSYQQWITLPDRIIGCFEVYPTGSSAAAYQVDGRVRFTYGRSGTMYPKSIKKEIDQQQYAYGKYRAYIHGHDFQTVLTDTAGVIRDDVKQAEEIVFRFDESGGGTTKKTYNSSFKKYFIIEIRDSLSKTDAQVSRAINGNIKALIVKLNGKCYASFKNVGSTVVTADLSAAIIPGNTNEIHFSRLDSMVNLPIRTTNSTYSIPANEQILLVSSNDAADLGRGFQNYTELLKLNGVLSTGINTPVAEDNAAFKIENVVKNAGNKTMLATILSHDSVKSTVRLVDTKGAVLYQQKVGLSEGKNTVTLPEFSTDGVLILQVSNEKGNSVTRKIGF